MRALLPVLALIALLAVAPAAQAAKPRSCASADLRYPFEEGGPKTFGVFKLRVIGASCTVGHHAAHAWMAKFEASLRGEGALEVPKRAGGFVWKELAPNAAQTYRLRGTKGKTTVTFDYVVPNG
jgi:hypothetical protein